jgi:hypothetical protein
LRDEDVELLFDALTTDPPCTSHQDIADRTGWPLATVADALRYIRSPWVSSEWGWTVPHQPRGPGEHLYLAVLLEGDRQLDEAETIATMAGARSTSYSVATMSRNEAHAMRTIAQYVEPAVARLARQTAKALDGASAMAEQMAERLAASYNGQNRLV